LIHYLTHTEIDKKAWDECLTQAGNGIIYAYSWYLDAVCPGWEALVEGNYDRIMPLCIGKKFGIHYVYPPYFTQQLGVFSADPIEESHMLDFLRAIPDKFRFIDLMLNASNPLPVSKAFKTTYLRTHLLDLNRSHAELYKHYAENTRRNIKKAVKNHLTVHTSTAVDQLLSIFRQSVGKNIHNLKDTHYERLYDLIHLCLRQEKGRIMGVSSPDGQLLAGAVFIYSHGKFIYLFSAADEMGKQTGAMHYLVDTFIKEHAGHSFLLDFEGGNASNLARFYKSFGAAEQHYPHLIQNKLPPLLKWIKN
jgi:hypothetical protein